MLSLCLLSLPIHVALRASTILSLTPGNKTNRSCFCPHPYGSSSTFSPARCAYMTKSRKFRKCPGSGCTTSSIAILHMCLPVYHCHTPEALIDVDRFNFVRVQLCQDRQRPARPLHLKRIRRVAGAPNPHCAPRGSALRSQGLRPQVSRQEMRQAEGSKPFLPALVRLFVLLVVRHTHVLQPHRVAKVDGGQGLRLRRCLRRVLGLVGLVLHAGQLVTARLRITSLGSLQSPLALLHGLFPPTPFKYLSFSPDNPHKRALEEILKPGALSRKRPTTPSYENFAL